MNLPTARAADPARLEQTALEVVLRAAEDG
jgi:hypothetical protein